MTFEEPTAVLDEPCVETDPSSRAAERNSSPRLLQGLVISSEKEGVKLLTEMGPVRAKIALGYDYRPAVGDLLLAIGQGEEAFVIGVLRGRGASVLSFPGDVDVRAPQGRMRLFAAGGVSVHAPDVSVRAGKIQLFSDILVEKARDAYRFVRGLFQLRAGNRHTIVQGNSYEKAGRVYVRSENEVNVDGKSIQLG